MPSSSPRIVRSGFPTINFGYTDAQTEGANEPALLTEGFLDEQGWIEDALGSRVFLFLGYKGAGKTAVAEHVKLLSEKRPHLFVTNTSLEDFPYGDFKSAAGTGEPQARYPAAWMWLLLLSLMESLGKDEGGREKAPVEYRSIAETLRSMNLLPVPRLNSLVVTSSKKSFKATLPRLLEYGSEKTSEVKDIQLTQAVSVVQRAAEAFPTASQHVVFVDGLDEVLTQRDLQFQVIAALLMAVQRLNGNFVRAGRKFKFVVLCRTDIFEHLPGANLSKIRRDGARSLTWYQDPKDPNRTPLVRVVNLRASLGLSKAHVNVFSEFLPSTTRGKPTRKLLLDHTRHLPRDVLQLFTSRQGYADDGERMLERQIEAGLREYSIEYFLPAIRDELHGHLQTAEVDKALSLMTGLTGQRVALGELEQRRVDLGLGKVDVQTLARVLFECSALALMDEDGEQPHFTFRYRNPGAPFDPACALWVHPGLCKALNIESHRPRRAQRHDRPSSRRP